MRALLALVTTGAFACVTPAPPAKAASPAQVFRPPPVAGGPFDFSARKPPPADGGTAWEMSHLPAVDSTGQPVKR